MFVKIFQVSAVKERGYKVSLSMASFLLNTSSKLCLGPGNLSAHNNYVILSDGTYALISIVAHK